MRLDSKKFSLQARFSLATGLAVVAFLVVSLVMLGSFYIVRTEIRSVQTEQLEQTLDSFRKTLDLSQFFVRLRKLQVAFYGNDEYLQQEAGHLLKRLEHYEIGILNSVLREELLPIRSSLSSYLQQCSSVNGLLTQLNREEKGIDEGFVLLENLAAEQLLQQPVREEQPADARRLSFLIAKHRVAMLETVQSYNRENPEQFFNASFFDPSPNTNAVTRLIKELEVLSSAPTPIDRYGRYMSAQLNYYLHLSNRFQQEMIHLGQAAQHLAGLSDAALRKVESLDRRLETESAHAIEQIDRNLLKASLVALGLLILLILLSGLIQRNLFVNHVRAPMFKIRKRLLAFKRGDYSTPLQLQRGDEWGQIEETFNAMLAALAESWAAVQKSESRYQNFYDNASEGIFHSTLDGDLIDMNPAMAAMFGYQPKQVTGRNDQIVIQFYVHPEDRKRLIDRLLCEKVVNGFKTEMQRSNGDRFWAVINCHLVKDEHGNDTLLEGTIEDDSVRRQNEQVLLDLKEHLHDIVDAMPSVLIGVNNKLQVTLWNRTAAKLSGKHETEVLETPLQQAFTLVDVTSCLGLVEETLTTREVTRLEKVTGQGESRGRIYDLLIYPLSSSEQPGAMIHMDDVTEKSRIEEVMVQSEKMHSIGSLAAGVAHEINNPLASVLQNVQVMSQRLSPDLKKNQLVAEQLGINAEQIAEYARQRGLNQMIDSIAVAGKRVAHIIENMLNFSRQSSSTFLPHSLQDLVEKTIELASNDYDMKHHFDFRAITVERDYQQVADVPCEPGQIQQVVLSLLKNAAQSFGTGTEHPEIRIRIHQNDQRVCLQIEDNGVGMDDVTKRRIFEPFYTTQEVGEGTGLGLSVAYFLIVENHKGALSVDSRPGEGSCFTICLPLVR